MAVIATKKHGKTFLTINGVTKALVEWAKEYEISERTLHGRIKAGWDEAHILDKAGNWKRKAKFNEHYFDLIDSENKAYWLGFMWCDGYMAVRHRDGRTSYEFKLSLVDTDGEHLKKLNRDLNGQYDVHYYNSRGSYGNENSKEARLLITNQHFGKTLVDKYGLIPRRQNCSKVLENIPEHLMRHFIRGLIDADGSFSKYNINERGYSIDKYRVSIGTNEDIVRAVERHLMDKGIICVSERKLYKRHANDGADGEYRTLEIAGKRQCLGILNYVYENACVYLDRKYEKYKSIVGLGMEGFDAVQAV